MARALTEEAVRGEFKSRGELQAPDPVDEVAIKMITQLLAQIDELLARIAELEREKA